MVVSDARHFTVAMRCLYFVVVLLVSHTDALRSLVERYARGAWQQENDAVFSLLCYTIALSRINERRLYSL
jgi:hypothetical protein